MPPLLYIIINVLIWVIKTSAESEEGIAHAIVRGNVDFERDPWPKVSKEAKELVMGMLDPNPYSRMTVEEVLGIYIYLYALLLFIIILFFLSTRKVIHL